MINTDMFTFRHWLEAYQQVFPFASEEDPPDVKRIQRFKNKDNYVRAMTRGGRNTEQASRELISKPFNHPWVGQEEILSIHPNAFTIPEFTFPNGLVREKRYIAFVHVRTVDPANLNQPKYNKPRYRLLAFYQGTNPKFTKNNVLQGHQPIGGLAHMGSYIDTVWVDKEYQGSKANTEANVPNLYKALREFAKNIGYPSLEPGDELTSKSYRAAQAKYDWKRAQELQQESAITPIHQALLDLRPQMAAASQEIYDNWDQSDEYDEYAGGGICQDIADAIVDVIYKNNLPIEAQAISATCGDQHVWTIAMVGNEGFEIDIPYYTYETGAAYTWHKIPDVKFSPEHIDIQPMDDTLRADAQASWDDPY